MDIRFSKKFLNDILENEAYEDLIIHRLHSDDHYHMVFSNEDKLYKAYFIEGMQGARWLSENPNSTEAECTEVVKKEVTHTVISYEDVHDEPVATPPSLDYYL